MANRFVSKPIEPAGEFASAPVHSEPSLPSAFRFEGEDLPVKTLLRTWRSTKNDRGDTYLKRHWFEFETPDGRLAIVYYDRSAHRRESHWFLYTITSE